MSVICCGAVVATTRDHFSSASEVRCEHLVGMLDRDQRTTKTKTRLHPNQADTFDTNPSLQSCCHPCAIHQRFSSNSNCFGESSAPVGGYHVGPRRRDSLLAAITHNLFPRRKAHGRRRIYTQKIYYLRKSLQKLTQLLTVTIYLLALVGTVPGALSAPTNHRRSMAANSASALSLAEQRANSQPKWVNPCGFKPIVQGDNGGDSSHNGSPSDDNGVDGTMPLTRELLDRIVAQTAITSRKAQEFKEDFAQKTFNQNADQVSFNNNVFEWLPSKDEIPKELGTFVSMDHLSSLSLDETLLNTYEYLQKIAVGLEQIHWDQQDYHGKFVQQFKDSENHLRLLLCEIQTAIMQRGVQLRPDVTRDLMPREHRTTDKTFRKLRDWIIYREYMNALEYVKQVFEHLKQLEQ